MYYAFKGYFDKEDAAMLIQRKVAQVIWGGNGGKANEFEQFWPLPDSLKTETVAKTWGTKEEAAELKRKIMQAHKIKL